MGSVVFRDEIYRMKKGNLAGNLIIKIKICIILHPTNVCEIWDTKVYVDTSEISVF